MIANSSDIEFNFNTMSFIHTSSTEVGKSLVIIDLDNHTDKKFINSDFNDSFVIDDKYSFELALVLKKKELNAPLLHKAIMDRISEKMSILSGDNDSNTICMIGHSQIDNWEIESLCGYRVQNCGIRGISSFEYNDYILNENIVKCNADYYIVMHGTNDIVTNASDGEIVKSIEQTFQYIYTRKPSARIIFLSCAHINGRLDRNNKRISQLNDAMWQSFTGKVEYIDISDLDDEFGDLKPEYTKDGLHFSEQGYDKLKQIVESKIRKQ